MLLSIRIISYWCRALIGPNQDKSLCPLYDSCVLESTRATRDPYSDTDSNNYACRDFDSVTLTHCSKWSWDMVAHSKWWSKWWRSWWWWWPLWWSSARAWKRRKSKTKRAQGKGEIHRAMLFWWSRHLVGMIIFRIDSRTIKRGETHREMRLSKCHYMF